VTAVALRSGPPLDFQKAETVIREASAEELTDAGNELVPLPGSNEILGAIFAFRPRIPE